MKIEDVWQEWKVEKKIGRGSFGTVYKCVKEEDGKKEYAAIKVISVPGDDVELQSGGSLERMTAEQSKAYYKEIIDGFMQETAILASLKGHPNIVRVDESKIVEDPDCVGWHLFIRMELLTDFNAFSCDRTFTEKDVVKLASDLSSALKACAEKNIVHRDIKPENIFVDDNGNFKLGDFGVAKQLERTETAMSRKGTLNYMAPEVLNAQKGDSRADIYSLGIVMYQLLNNNRLPFLDPNKQFITHSERQKAFKRRTEDGEKLPALPNVSPELNAIILKATQFKKEDRFRNIDEFSEALALLSGKKKSAKIRRLRWSKARKAAIAVLALLLLLAAGCGVFAVVEPELTHLFVERVSMRLMPEETRAEKIHMDLGETGDYQILDSGIVNGIFCYENTDYYADASGFYKVAADGKPKQLIRKPCLPTFTILKDKIYFTVAESTYLDVSPSSVAEEETAAGENTTATESKPTSVKYFCWTMNLKGGHPERLFVCQGLGQIVYETEENIYYVDYKKGKTEKQLKRVSKNDYSDKEIIQGGIDDIAFVDHYLIFNQKGADGNATKVFSFDVWKNEPRHHFPWETVNPVEMERRVVCRGNETQLFSLAHEALLAFVETNNEDLPVALSLWNPTADKWETAFKVKSGAVSGLFDTHTLMLQMRKKADDPEQYYMYSFEKNNFDKAALKKGLSTPLTSEAVFHASFSKVLQYELRETTEEEFYLAKTDRKSKDTENQIMYSDVLPELNSTALIGNHVVLLPNDEANPAVYTARSLAEINWTEVNPDKLFLGSDYKGIQIEYLQEGKKGFLFRPDGEINLRYKPDYYGAARNERIRQNHPEPVIILSKEVDAGKYSYILCQRLADGRKSWVSFNRVFEGAFGEQDNLKYETVQDTGGGIVIALRGFVSEEGLKSEVKLPDKLLNINVAQINDGAFENCERLTSVTLPNNLKKIGAGAFQNCTKLKTVAQLSSVTTIEDKAFENCESLQSIALPGGLKTLGQGVFNNSGITQLTVPGNLGVLDRRTFSGWTGIKHVKVSSPIYEIGIECFSGCTDLETIELPSSIKTIGAFAFSGCRSLQGINLEGLDKSFDGISRGTFQGCGSLKKIVLPESVIFADDQSFEGCSDLETFTVMNRNCQMNGCGVETATVRGYAGSTAEAFANDCGLRFKPFKEAVNNAPAIDNDT